LQGKTGGEMNVDSVKKALIFAAAAVFLIFFCGLSSAGAFDQEPVDRTLFLAQATQESTNETGEPLGLHVGQHLAQHTEISADTLSKAPDDVFTDQANEPVELPSLRFSLLMAEQTQESGEEQAKEDQEDEDEYDDDYEDEYGDEDVQLISDPLIQGNTDFYNFNDTMYFWVLKPISRGYGFIIPEELRTAIRNAFYNIRFPVRFINCLLQGKGRKATDEFSQFFLNTTVGFLGLANIAAAETINIQPSKEDLGQTFAVWGIGQGPYLMVPIFGPYSLRHGIGAIGDTFLDPLFWLFDDIRVSLILRAGETVNDVSLRIGEYEALKEAALDPYVMIRNAYVQNRNKLIAE
jgi:phospholipid-binding lipoprotein MlaA